MIRGSIPGGDIMPIKKSYIIVCNDCETTLSNVPLLDGRFPHTHVFEVISHARRAGWEYRVDGEYPYYKPYRKGQVTIDNVQMYCPICKNNLEPVSPSDI